MIVVVSSNLSHVDPESKTIHNFKTWLSCMGIKRYVFVNVSDRVQLERNLLECKKFVEGR